MWEAILGYICDQGSLFDHLFERRPPSEEEVEVAVCSVSGSCHTRAADLHVHDFALPRSAKVPFYCGGPPTRDIQQGAPSET